MAEWLKAPHSKCGVRATVSGVRILPLRQIPLKNLSKLDILSYDLQSTPAVQALQGTDLAEVEATLLGNRCERFLAFLHSPKGTAAMREAGVFLRVK